MKLSDTLEVLTTKPTIGYTRYEYGVTNGNAFYETVTPPLYHDLYNGKEPVPYAQAALSQFSATLFFKANPKTGVGPISIPLPQKSHRH